ncbi:hypothetical protein PT974_02065 [Cladobotryum mycophilum]|uniref:Uncharacterized protein n=1 Tax=Cladobotryum mycophilum TaxID=491253 RepID=A0ABR0SY85_9HYPO
MSDGIAPAIDKVGAPEPTAPEAQAGAPTMDTGKNNIAVCPPAPLEKAEEAPTDAPKTSEETKPIEAKMTDAPASAAAHIIPKPVEIQSVPETPVKEGSPANGSPQPELNISMETDEAEKSNQGDEVPPGVLEPLPTPTASIPSTDEPITEITPNGVPKPAEMTGALQTEDSEKRSESTETGTGEKRKLDDSTGDDESDEQSQEKQGTDEIERADKKIKVDAAAETKTNGGTTKGKPGRPRKDKSAPPIVGRTARKTRSQGPVEV